MVTEMVGGAIYDKNDNLIYEGEFKNNLRNGNGKVFNDNGDLEYEGIFKNNRSQCGNFYSHSDNFFINQYKNGYFRTTLDILNGKKNLIVNQKKMLIKIHTNISNRKEKFNYEPLMEKIKEEEENYESLNNSNTKLHKTSDIASNHNKVSNPSKYDNILKNIRLNTINTKNVNNLDENNNKNNMSNVSNSDDRENFQILLEEENSKRHLSNSPAFGKGNQLC